MLRKTGADAFHLSILDISTPATITEAGSIGPLNVTAADSIFVYNGHAYIGLEGYGLLLVDATDPANPTVGDINEDLAFVKHIEFDNNQGVIARGDQRVQVARVEADGSLTMEADISTSDPWQAIYHNNLILTADGVGGFLLSERDYANNGLSIVASFGSGDFDFRFLLRDNILYGNTGTGYLSIFNLDTPDQPQLLSKILNSTYQSLGL